MCHSLQCNQTKLKCNKTSKVNNYAYEIFLSINYLIIYLIILSDKLLFVKRPTTTDYMHTQYTIIQIKTCNCKWKQIWHFQLQLGPEQCDRYLCMS